MTHNIDTPCSPPNDVCPIKEFERTGVPVTTVHTHYDNSGKPSYVQVTAHPIKDKKGRVVKFIHMGRDVSEQKKAEGERNLAYKRLEKAYEELKDVDRLKTDIISNVSHELRTPLTISKTAVELAKEEKKIENQAKLFAMAERALERLNDIIDNLVAASDIHKGKHRLAILDFDLKELFNELMEERKTRLMEGSVHEISLEMESHLPFLKGDKASLKKAFKNIIDNSIKFRKVSKAFVKISAWNENGTVRVSISDEGIGIPHDKLDVIFAPLYQIDPSTTREYEGTGMGLAIAKSIIIAHGGKIWAESILGEGTTIQISLPA